MILTAAVAAVLVVAAAATAKSTDTTITGAGSTFVQPLVNAWTPALGHAYGLSVQFGASDAPLTPDQQAACSDCVQIPWALSAVTLMYNVPGAPAHMKLDGNTISKIFLGEISNWNDPAIAALNKGANLPSLKITPVFRSDGSGTSYAFTDYLSAVNAGWKSKIGVSTQPAFPAGQGAKGSSGVAGLVSRTSGAISYVDVAYAIANHLHFAAVKNAAGAFLYPSLRRIQAAAVAFPKVPANNELHIVNPPKSAKLAYPISTYTYVVVHKTSPHAKQLKQLIQWAVTQGQTTPFAAKLTFAKLSTVKAVLVAAEKTAASIHS
jgi:phosphate transport system substrate-binding protein